VNLETALNNLEDPHLRGQQPRSLLPLLEPIESSIKKLADVAKSFSLFSRRYQDEGLEQTSVNAILLHVDTIYNVGPSLRKARLHWQHVEPDILIYTQTAKLVMLLISLSRHIAWEGGTHLSIVSIASKSGLHLSLKYRINSIAEAPIGKGEVPAKDELIFDPELNEGLTQELCEELKIEVMRAKEGAHQFCYNLEFSQESCQAKVA